MWLYVCQAQTQKKLNMNNYKTKIIMKKRILLIALIGMSFGLNAQSIPVQNSNYHYYGPNSTWGEYLKVGGNGRETTKASVVSTNGNLHLDSKDGKATYLNHYSKGNTVLNTRGGTVGVGTASPDSNSGLHMYQNRYTLYGPNTTWGAYLQVGGNGRTTNYASVVSTNGNLHLDSKDGKATYLNHYSKGNTVLNTRGGSVGIGTTNPGSWKLAVNGKIRAKEIKVETGWSDFVFENDYKLPTLQDVEKQIKEKGHLKDIPSAKEVEKNGILIGEMNSKLLQKIEELTLYAIEQEKKIKKLESFNTRFIEFQKRLEKMEKENHK